MRKRLYEGDRYKLEDRLMRSYGILKYAVTLTSEEAMKRLSDVRMGVELGIISDVTLERLNGIIYEVLPANIMKNYNLTDAADRDLKRAEIVRERMCV